MLLSPNYLALYPSSSSGHLWFSSVNQIILYRKLEVLYDILGVSKMICLQKFELTVRIGVTVCLVLLVQSVYFNFMLHCHVKKKGEV